MASFQVLLLALTALSGTVLGAPVIHWITPRHGSLAGGTTVDMYGRGFATDSYTSHSLILIGQIPCVVIQYHSSPTRLRCVTQPHPEGQEDSVHSPLQSSLLTDGVLTASSGGHNQFTYHWHNTPQIRDIVPRSGPVSALVELGGYRTSGNLDHYTSVTLGNGICETRNRESNRRYGFAYRNSLRYLRCRSTELKAGAWNGSMTLQWASGTTWNHSQALYPVHDWSLAMYELFPDIHSVTPQVGSVRGGTVVTITGTGFKVDEFEGIAVDIDGIPCRVLSGSSEEIRCVTGTPPAASIAIADQNMDYPITDEGYRFRGSRGANYFRYTSIRGEMLSNLHESVKYPDQPDYFSVYPSYSTTPTGARKGDNYGVRFTAFFKPHASGNHTLYVANDDQAGVWLSHGSNISEVGKIITSPRPTGFSNFYRSSNQKSATLSLEEGEDYLLVAELKEGTGLDYLQVGLLLDETNFTRNQTHQVVQERQSIEMRTAGLYEIQRLQVSLNMSEVDETTPPTFVMQWGGRETGPLSLLELDSLNSSVIGLLSGVCGDAFGQELGFSHYNDIVFGYEDQSTIPVWTSWDSDPPIVTNEKAFCGRQSLYVQQGRVRAPHPNTEEDGVRVSDYPYLCLSYNVPPGQDMVLALHIRSIGWRSVTTSSTQLTHFENLGSFWDYSDDEYLQDDNDWHFACTDVQTMLSITLAVNEDPDNDENTIQSTIVDGLGFYSTEGSTPLGFYVDEVSFSSEIRQFYPDLYFPPAQPDGIPIHNVSIEVVKTNDSDILNSTILFTIIPAACETAVPLIGAALANREDMIGVLQFDMSVHQQASAPIGGSYSLSLESYTTASLPHNASALEIKAALEALDSISRVTVTQPQPLPQDSLGKMCPGRRFEIIFEDIGSNLPLLGLESRGLFGSGLSTRVEEVTAGGLFLRPIPGHMLQTAEITPQVHVRIQGQLAACSGKNDLYVDIPYSSHRDYCGFSYGPTATPTVTGIEPGQASRDATITITGTGFSEVLTENYVLFGDVECTMLSATMTRIECMLGAGYAGFKGLYLHVIYAGVAETNAQGLAYDLVLSGVAPRQGSQTGGTEMTITGSGFYHETSGIELPPHVQDMSTECVSGWRNEATIGGRPCIVVQSTGTSLTVKTPAEVAGGTGDLEVFVVCLDNANISASVVLANAFTYDSVFTPSLTSVVPSMGAVQGGQTVMISGLGFSPNVLDNEVLFGDAACVVTMSTETLLTCTTPPHAQGEVEVSVVVRGKGKASGAPLFTFMIQLDSISHCSGSIFGGQVLSFSGSGFGSDSSQIGVSFGGRPCDVVRVVDEEILCVTSPASSTHYVNNNAFHEEYGLGYSWNPASLVIRAGDTVRWSWTGSPFATRRGVAQVNGPQDMSYTGVGFRSKRSTTGEYSATFTKPGAYHYITEGYAHIGFRGTITVVDLEDIVASLSLTISSIPLNISDHHIQCNETSSDFLTYTYAVSATPTIRILSQQRAVVGDSIALELRGLSDVEEDNILVFGNSDTPCSSPIPSILSTTRTHPSRDTITVARTYDSYSRSVQCVLPSLPSGKYRPVLHVAGRGWGYSHLEDTVVTLYPQITSAPSIPGGSLRGGTSVTMSTRGLSPEDMLQTRVKIGNTPCRVEDIDSQGALTCFTQAAMDDGFSSLVEASAPLAYWSLQTDYHRSDGSYLDSDGTTFFRSAGILGIQANASIHGLVSLQQTGISGNDITDQSIGINAAAFLHIPDLEGLFGQSQFALEFWVRVPHPAPHYRILVDAASSCDGNACGFVALLNPCDQMEFWVASRDSSDGENQDGSRGSGSGSGGLLGVQGSGESGESGESSEGLLANGRELYSIPDGDEPEACEVITASSQCRPQSASCTGYITVSDQGNLRLPTGVWHVIRSNQSNWSDWNHVYMSWRNSEMAGAPQEDCALLSTCNGTQELAVNGAHQSAFSMYHRANTGMDLGGSSSIPLGTTGTWSGIAPFTGHLDEVAYYSHPLRSQEISDRINYVMQGTQPIWLEVEGFDGVGVGSIPSVVYPVTDPPLNPVTIDWEAATQLDRVYETSTMLQFQWTGSRGVRQVPHAVFQSCDLKADYLDQWADNLQGGRVNVPLEMAGRYYFIDSAVEGCLEGRKLSVQIGNVHTVEWRLGVAYEYLTVPEGTGLIFQWSGSYHNLLEMSSPVGSDCKFVNKDSTLLGQVRAEWLKVPTASGEVLVNDLSVGEHYFACSVGDHCVRGMRLTVRVVPVTMQETPAQESQATPSHIVRWLIQDYEDLTIVEGEAVTFAWDGFHSLHQVTESVYETCNSSAAPLHVWEDASVDNTATIQHLTPGNYYFICSVAGHCAAGMKIKVIVLPDDGLLVLSDPVPAECAENAGCYYSYSPSPEHTPRLTRVDPVGASAGSILTLYGTGLLPPGTLPGAMVDSLEVWLGNALCPSIMAQSHSTGEDVISCTVPNYESGYYHVDVHVQGKGYASVHPTPLHPGLVRNSTILPSQTSVHPRVFLEGVMNNLSPTRGSVLGGSELTIGGSGFSISPSRISVRIGEVPCEITSSSHSEIVCTTGPSLSPDADIMLNLRVTVNSHPVSRALHFTYSLAATPILSSLSMRDASGGEIIAITGSRFGAIPQVQIVTSLESFSGVQAQDECVVMSASDTEITCTLPIKPAGRYQVLVIVENLGYARADTDAADIITYTMSVGDFSPLSGGYGGGIVLSVRGHGFPTVTQDGSTAGVNVTLCDTPCSVVTSTLSTLTCVLSPTRSPRTPNSSLACNLTLEHNGVVATSGESFVFTDALTPRLVSITPMLGGTGGGTLVTLTGSGLLPPDVLSSDQLNSTDISVRIDGVSCDWANSMVADTEIQCRTGSHQTTLQALVEVTVRGKGKAEYDENSVMFEYVDLWSSQFTWGGEDPPALGESVYIKTGQTVYLDISPPELNLILIEGAMVFSDEQDLHLQAKYIFVNNGTLQVGTEEEPFKHRAIITLHGHVTDPEIPIYGAKVLGVRQGHLDLHGCPRNVTWTRLASTAQANTSTLTLQQDVDWRAGDRIVIAPTGKNGNETEEHEVLRVDGRTVELTRPLDYTHHGVTETFADGNFIEMRAEVGLLSHNIIVQGHIEGQRADQYGAQIFIHRMGPHPTPIRIEHVEVRQSGQAFRLGRYSIHFHLSGSMNGSYVRHCSIHHSFNRAITAHGVHDLLIEGNVAYDIMGHTYFVEDGVETNNRYMYNLGVLTRGSSSLLNTDQLPATFWITNPQNTFIGNAAAASRAYGFWYDLDNFPSGASYTRSVCPNKARFGEFRDNIAHTCNEFGLRIWERYTPYVDECGATELGEATLHDFTSFANGIHGVELSVVGHVRLTGFKVADNVVNGIEIQETLGEWGGPGVMNSLIVSHTSINTGEPQTGGLKTPNTPRLTVTNVTFANFDLPSTSSLRACSHCKVRQGGFEVHFQELRFIGGSEQHKTAFQWEFEVLYRDLDGTLTGLPGGGWVLPDSTLVPNDLCTPSVPAFSGNSASFNGTVCGAQVHFLRMAWNRAMPLSTLRGVTVNVSNEFGITEVPWRHYRLTHTDGYMFTGPQGYQHTINWLLPDTSRVDTTSYQAGVYGLSPDSRLWITHELVMLPDHVNVGGNNMITEHGAVPTLRDENFSWFIDNQTNIVTYLINGGNVTGQTVTFSYNYEPCPPDGCPPPGIDYGPYESRQRRWSDPNSWPDQRLPAEGENVTVSSRWRMLLDVTPPPLGNVYIYGELMFEDTRDHNITANLILVYGPNSRLIIGTEQSPFSHQVTITLTGRRNDRPLVLGRRTIVGSKAVGIFGNVSIHGMPKAATWSRLTASVLAGSNTIEMPAADVSDWRVGNQIVIAPSGYDPMQSEIRTIASINGGLLTLTESLEHEHVIHAFLDPGDLQQADPISAVNESAAWWGDGGSIAPEVGLLTRNIVIQGGEDAAEPLETHHYGCRILVGRYDASRFTLFGNLKMDSVEVRFCGQGGYFSPRDPRYAIAFRNNFELSSGSYVRRSSVHHGYNTAIGIHTSNGVEISGNVVWRTTDSSLKVGGRGNLIRDNLAMMTVTVQPNSPPDNHAVDFPATYDIDPGNTVHGNAAAGSTRLGFQFAGERCLEDNQSPTGEEEADFWGNTAHSGLIGLNVLGLPRECTAVGGFSTMFQWNYGIFSSTASSLVTTHLKVATGKVGVNLNVFGPNPVAHLLGGKFIRITDSLIVGSLPGEDCDIAAPEFRVRGGVSFAATDHKLGIMMSSFNQRRSKMDGTGAWHLMKGYPVIDGVLITRRLSFARFTNDHCNYGTYAIGNNPLSPDAVHPMQMTATSKYNVHLNSLAFFYEPDPEWIVQEDCVDMDCDGPKHALVRDIDGTFVSTHPTEGSIIPIAELRFSDYVSRIPRTWLAVEGRQRGAPITDPNQVVDRMGIARGQPGNLESEHGGCELRSEWQGYRCKGLQHHMLVIESLDADTETRRLSPIALHGGDTGAGVEYTDLINGPMDHGWCTYYTCLKRLSTFFTIVAAGSDYCVWMTGSPPSTIRFHLLNAEQDSAIKICMWFKSTQRKDVYKNGIFIEPRNVRYLEGGTVLQTDSTCENCVPQRDMIGGANYFNRESRIMHVILKGSDPVEIRTAPVIQVSLSLAVSIDEFFDVGTLIDNIAFVLNIDKSRIRVVKIVSEDGSSGRFRRSLLAVAVNQTSVTLEFGNPPAMNITMTSPPSIQDEIEMAREVNDSVDLQENEIPEVPLNGSNPLNEDPPETVEDFADGFNTSAISFIEEVVDYQEVLQEVEDANALGEQFVNLILTGGSENITNSTVLGISVIPALPPSPPEPPVVPPAFQNISEEEGVVTVTLDEVTIPGLDLVAGRPNNTGETDNEEVVINFVFPSDMRVTMEPHPETGHLVHVAVTIFDDNDDPVINLGIVNPWMCEASLATSTDNRASLEGELSTPFVRGVAEFTRLRVDRPEEELTLVFHSNPPRFRATTSVRFSVTAPPENTPRTRLGFVLRGDSAALATDSSTVLSSIRTGLGLALDVDVSRIKDITYEVTADGIVVAFDLLEKHSTDPPNVRSLENATEFFLTSRHFTISIGGSDYTTVPGTFDLVTPAPPTRVSSSAGFPLLFIVIIASGAGGLAVMVLMVCAMWGCKRMAGRVRAKNASGKVSPIMVNRDTEEQVSSRSEGSLSVADLTIEDSLGDGDCWPIPSPPHGSISSLVSSDRPSPNQATPHPHHQATSLAQMANPTGFDCLHSHPNSGPSPRVAWANPVVSSPPDSNSTRTQHYHYQ